MTGETLAGGRYALGRRVGAGGMADVYIARDIRLDRDVAVKVFRPGTADGIARGSAEARLLAGLDHPGLVRVLDMDTGERPGDSAYLVMEYIPGPDLGQLLRGGPLDREGVRHLGLDLARALSHIHQRGVVHRDIKPSNILTRDADPDSGIFTYLLTDFGIARFFDGGGMTATGQVIGSAAYFSPEQARGDAVGMATDIYSLGLVLIESLAGERAFPGTGVESALARLQRSPSIPASAGPELTELLAAMTLDDPAARPDAQAVAAAFGALHARPGPSPVLPPPPVPAVPLTSPTSVLRPHGAAAAPAESAADATAPSPAAGTAAATAPLRGAEQAAPAGSGRVEPATEAFERVHQDAAAGHPPATRALPGHPPAQAPRAGGPEVPARHPVGLQGDSGRRPQLPPLTVDDDGEADWNRAPHADPVAGGYSTAGPARGGVVSGNPAQGSRQPRGNAAGTGGRRRRTRVGLILMAAALLVVAVLAAAVTLVPERRATPEPLPAVSGPAGEKLKELYESVTP